MKGITSGLGPTRLKDGGFPDLTGDGKVTRADILKGRGVEGFKDGGNPRFLSREGFFNYSDDPERLNARDIGDLIFNPNDPLDYVAAGAAATGVGIPAALGVKTANTGRKILNTGRKVAKGIGATLATTPIAREGIDFMERPAEYSREIIDLVSSMRGAPGTVGNIAQALAEAPIEVSRMIYESVADVAGYPVDEVEEKADGGIMQMADGGSSNKKKKVATTMLDILEDVESKINIPKTAPKVTPKKTTPKKTTPKKTPVEKTTPKKTTPKKTTPKKTTPKKTTPKKTPKTKPPQQPKGDGPAIKKKIDEANPDFKGGGTGEGNRASRILEATGRGIGKTAKTLGKVGVGLAATYGGLTAAQRMGAFEPGGLFGSDIPEPGSTIENISPTGSGSFPGGVDFSQFPAGTQTTTTKTGTQKNTGGSSTSSSTSGSGALAPGTLTPPGEFNANDIAESSKFKEIMKYNLIEKGFKVDDKGNFAGQEPTFIDYLKVFPSTYMDKVGRDEGFAKKMMAGFLNMMRPVEGFVPVNSAVAFGDAYLGEETRQSEMETAMMKTLKFLEKNPGLREDYLSTLKASSGVDPLSKMKSEEIQKTFDLVKTNKIEQYVKQNIGAKPENLYLAGPDGIEYDSTQLYKLQNLDPAIIAAIADTLQVMTRYTST